MKITIYLALLLILLQSNCADAVSSLYIKQSDTRETAQPSVIKKGSEYKNVLTKEKATVTGNILVLAQSNSQLKAIADTYNLHLVSTTSGVSLAVMSTKKDSTDLELLVEKMALDKRVIQVKLELNETRFYNR